MQSTNQHPWVLSPSKLMGGCLLGGLFASSFAMKLASYCHVMVILMSAAGASTLVIVLYLQVL